MGKKIFLLAGEASGDLHGANLAMALKKIQPESHLEGWGGPKMEASGVQLHRTLKDLAFMGFVEVVTNIWTVKKNFSLIKQHLIHHKPDALVLIDYPGFNLKIAKWAHRQGIRVFYFISPTVWAWKADRANIIRESVEQLYCILPFEVDFYKQLNYDVTYVGNPLVDSITRFTPDEGFLAAHNFCKGAYIAVLPGSRHQELKRILPVMVGAMAQLPQKKFVIARTSLLPEEEFTSILDRIHPDWKKNVSIVTDKTYDVLFNASSAMVTSGTATLETALLNIPQVVCYAANSLNILIAKAFVKVKYISLVNLIPDKAIVKELIQQDLTVSNLSKEVLKLEGNADYRKNMLNEYAKLKSLVGEPGVADRMAQDILKRLD